MTNDELTRLAINGYVAELPEEDQVKVKECKAKLLVILKEYGEVHGGLALASLGADAAVGDQEE